MTHHFISPPKLDPARIDQMISNAISTKQETKTLSWVNRLTQFRSDFRPGFRLGVGLSLATASIAGILWLNAAQMPETTAPAQIDQADLTDLVIYEMLEDLV